MLLTPEKAREQALHDWESQAALNLVVGTVDIAGPRLRPGDNFYTESISCDFTDEAELYCRTYNLTIRSLLQKYGVPAWVPGKRLPDAFACLKILADNSSPFSNYHPASGEEESAVKRVLFHWGSARPSLHCRLLPVALLLWGGTLADQSGRVDVLDCLNGPQWLASYRFSRTEFPQLPWKEREIVEK